MPERRSYGKASRIVNLDDIAVAVHGSIKGGIKKRSRPTVAHEWRVGGR